MVSNPSIQIAFALLSASRVVSASRAELRAQAQELARLLDPEEICPACWRLASNGTRGGQEHQPETLCVWGG